MYVLVIISGKCSKTRHSDEQPECPSSNEKKKRTGAEYVTKTEKAHRKTKERERKEKKLEQLKRVGS